MEQGKIGGTRTPKLLNRLSQNLAWVITSAIWPSKPKFKPIASVERPGKWVKYHSCVVIIFFSFFVTPKFACIQGLNKRTDFYTLWFIRFKFQVIVLGIKLQTFLFPTFIPNTPQKKREWVKMLGTLNSLKLKILKLAYNRNHCIDFSQILDSDKDRQIVCVGGPNKRITNPRWRTAAILK